MHPEGLRPAPNATQRPRDLAELMLASRDLLPRQRARDQQADLAGLEMKRRLLERVVAADPEPDDLEQALLAIVEALGPPTGPTRALALSFRDDWLAACAAPEWIGQLLGEALRDTANDRTHGQKHRS
jgi:hypothetical protein